MPAAKVKAHKKWQDDCLSEITKMGEVDHEFLEMIDSLVHTVKAYGCFLPEDHRLYVTHQHSVRNISVSEIIKELECYELCCGVEAIELTSQLFHHVITIN